MMQKRKQVKDKMGKRCKITVGMILLVCLAVGCNRKDQEETSVVMENIQDIEETAKEEKPEQTTKSAETEKGDDSENSAQPEENKNFEGTKEGSHIVVPEKGEEHLSGRVRSMGDNSVIISKIFIEESEDGNSDIVYLPGEEDQKEELVTVNFTNHTEFHYWVIKSGGDNIDMRESSFSEIKEGSNLEMYGNYDGEAFIASKVIIEVYE